MALKTYENYLEESQQLVESKGDIDLKRKADYAKAQQEALRAAIVDLRNYILNYKETDAVRALLTTDVGLMRKLKNFPGDITWARIAKSYEILAKSAS